MRASEVSNTIKDENRGLAGRIGGRDKLVY